MLRHSSILFVTIPLLLANGCSTSSEPWADDFDGTATVSVGALAKLHVAHVAVTPSDTDQLQFSLLGSGQNNLSGSFVMKRIGNTASYVGGAAVITADGVSLSVVQGNASLVGKTLTVVLEDPLQAEPQRLTFVGESQ